MSANVKVSEWMDEHRIIPRIMGAVFLWISIDVYLLYKHSVIDGLDMDYIACVAILTITAGFCKFYMENRRADRGN